MVWRATNDPEGVRRLESNDRHKPPCAPVAGSAGTERVDTDLVGRNRGRSLTATPTHCSSILDVLNRVRRTGDLYAGSLARIRSYPSCAGLTPVE
jgi:hypothetical protein